MIINNPDNISKTKPQKNHISQIDINKNTCYSMASALKEGKNGSSRTVQSR